MRAAILSVACLGVLGLSAYLSGQAPAGDVPTRLRLQDAATGTPRAGLVRIFREGSDKPLPLPGLYDRLRGLGRLGTTLGWHVVPAGGATVSLPRARLRLEALAGLETALARRDLDLTASAPEEVRIPLAAVFDPAEQGLVAGNTHLHLRNLTLEEADEYLRQIPVADGLRVLFLSYLERHKDDATYISNRYPIGELKQFTATGVLFDNGEEHRHNFEGFGQGYGHVMFLGIRSLVKPVSLGPGITGAGTDDRPLRPGIDEARQQGGTVLWCHNTNGHEDVPSAVTGRLHGLNVFDGSRTGTYEENYYRYLNVGLRVPISTGTDWFLYDFARVYAQAATPLTVQGWLQALKAGRCVATNGPLLTLTVQGRPVGEVLDLPQPATVQVEARGVGRQDFQRLQLVHNGKVVATQQAERQGDRHVARISRALRFDAPGWLAVRIDTELRNELDRPLYAHSSPVYVYVAGSRVFDAEAARGLLRQVEEARDDIRARGLFSSDAARTRLLALYDEAADVLRTRMSGRGRTGTGP